MGDDYGGVAGTDRCSAYTWLKYRQYCWSHLLRDFQKILERGDDSYPVGWYLKLQAEYLLMKWARVRDGTLDYFEFLAEFPVIQTQIRHWLAQGLTVSSSHTVATCRLSWPRTLTSGALSPSQGLSRPTTAPNAPCVIP